jgi:hypothetical protein
MPDEACRWSAGSSVPVDLFQSKVQEADGRDAVVDFPDAEPLTGAYHRDIDLLAGMQMRPQAVTGRGS